MSHSWESLANEHILGIAPYEPGKPIQELERELGISDVIKLASNENPLSPSERAHLKGMGLAAPGGIGHPASLLKPPAGQEELWAGLDIARAAADATGLEVSLFNDGHSACWAQRVAHPTPRPLSFVFLVLDTFVGGGVMAENRLWEGPNGNAANLGAMLVTDSEGRIRYLREIASLWALEQRLKPVGVGLEALQGTVSAQLRPVLDAWIADGTLGGDPPNAADLQIFSTLRLLMTLGDLRPLISGRPAGEAALRIWPHHAGDVPAGTFPPDWVPAKSASETLPFMSAALTSSGDRPGFAWRRSAAAPVTMGHAMLVPWLVRGWFPDPTPAESMAAPGALISGFNRPSMALGPRELKPAKSSAPGPV